LIVSHWRENADSSVQYTLNMLSEMRAQAKMDYPTVSVAIRRLAQLVVAGTRAAHTG
jgi:glutamate dehydrogenase